MDAEAVTIEHIIPLSFGRANGGTNYYDNKALSHRVCNTARGSNVTLKPHPDRIFDFVRARLVGAKNLSPSRPEPMPKLKKIPVNLRIDWSCIILRRVSLGWVGMAGSMRKSGRARVLRVTPPHQNRVIALADITGAIL